MRARVCVSVLTKELIRHRRPCRIRGSGPGWQFHQRRFQDSAEDTEGNAYVTTTFNVGAIAKISKIGDVTPWYIGDAAPVPYIYGGLVFDEATN